MDMIYSVYNQLARTLPEDMDNRYAIMKAVDLWFAGSNAVYEIWHWYVECLRR